MQRGRVTLLCRVMLTIALVGVAYAAFSPTEIAPSVGSDWLNHGIAFAILAILTAFALPTWSLMRVWFSLAVVGVGIEIVQAVPALGRGASVAEAGWDALIVGGVLGLMWLGSARSKQPGALESIH